MASLSEAIEGILSSPYGEFEGVLPEEDITLTELYTLQDAVSKAIEKKMDESRRKK